MQMILSAYSCVLLISFYFGLSGNTWTPPKYPSLFYFRQTVMVALVNMKRQVFQISMPGLITNVKKVKKPTMECCICLSLHLESPLLTSSIKFHCFSICSVETKTITLNSVRQLVAHIPFSWLMQAAMFFEVHVKPLKNVLSAWWPQAWVRCKADMKKLCIVIQPRRRRRRKEEKTTIVLETNCT